MQTTDKVRTGIYLSFKASKTLSGIETTDVDDATRIFANLSFKASKTLSGIETI